MTDLNELKKKYAELGEEIKRLEKQQFKAGHFYENSDKNLVVMCDGKEPLNSTCFSGIAVRGNNWPIGYASIGWDAELFHEVFPTWSDKEKTE